MNLICQRNGNQYILVTHSKFKVAYVYKTIVITQVSYAQGPSSNECGFRLHNKYKLCKYVAIQMFSSPNVYTSLSHKIFLGFYWVINDKYCAFLGCIQDLGEYVTVIYGL